MRLIILNGPAGVGKSTLAAQPHQHIPSSVLIEVDELRRAIPDYREWREESLLRAYELTGNAIENALKDGNDVIIDKAISHADTLDAFVAIGRKYGAEVYEFILFADKATVQKRATERGFIPSGLLTPEKVGELWDNMDVLRVERATAIVIDTTPMNPEEVFSVVLKTVLVRT